MEPNKSPHLNRLRADSVGKSPGPPSRRTAGNKSPAPPSRGRAESLGGERDTLNTGRVLNYGDYGVDEYAAAANKPDDVWAVLRPVVTSQFLERTAFYGVQGSMVLFLTKYMMFSSGSADSFVGLWSGLCFMTPLLGGFVGDSILGRWNGILLFFSIYVLGMGFVAFSSSLPPASAGMIFFPGSIVLAVGAGGLKPLVSTFGADQISSNDSSSNNNGSGEDTDEAEKVKEQYFNYLYWFQNCGAFVAFTLMVYLCQDVSFVAGFTTAAVCCALSFAVLWSGRSGYAAVLPLEDSPVATFFHVLYEAATRRVDGNLADHYQHASYSPVQSSSSSSLASLASSLESQQPAGAAAAAAGPSSSSSSSSSSLSWLDKASTRSGGSHGDGDIAMVKKMMRVMPVFFLLVVYWGINSQMSTTFFNQGCQMDLVIGGGGGSSGGLSVPVAALSLFNSVVIILFVPVFDSYVYPLCVKSGFPIRTPLEKMKAGMALEVVVMVLAAMLELYRKSIADSPGGLIGPSVCYDTTSGAAGSVGVPMAANLSIFWQVPLFVLMGVSEILTSISSMDFFYSEAPEEMKGVCSALELVTVSLGQWMTAFLVPAANFLPPLFFGGKAWIPSDLNAGCLDRFFYLLAALVFANTVAFSSVARRFTADSSGAVESS